MVERFAQIIVGQKAAKHGHILRRRPRERISGKAEGIGQRFGRLLEPDKATRQRFGFRGQGDVFHGSRLPVGERSPPAAPISGKRSTSTALAAFTSRSFTLLGNR